MIIGGEKMDILKKTLQFGFGLAYISKEHLEVLMKDLKDKYGLDEKQAKKLAKDIIKHSVDAHKEIKNVVKKHFDEFAKETVKSSSPKKKSPTKKKTTKKTTKSKKK